MGVGGGSRWPEFKPLERRRRREKVGRERALPSPAGCCPALMPVICLHRTPFTHEWERDHGGKGKGERIVVSCHLFLCWVPLSSYAVSLSKANREYQRGMLSHIKIWRMQALECFSSSAWLMQNLGVCSSCELIVHFLWCSCVGFLSPRLKI